MTRIRGQSGCQILELPTHKLVWKIAPGDAENSAELRDRLDKEVQHLILLRQANEKLFPRVISQEPDKYSMELLEMDGSVAVNRMMITFYALAESVWPFYTKNRIKPCPAPSDDWRRPFTEWLMNQHDRELFDIFLKLTDEWPYLFGDIDLIHGDCTFENTMQRGSTRFGPGALVLIDPVPPRANLPRSRWLDVGKLMQSAMGYEKFKYPDLFSYNPYRQMSLLMGPMSVPERAVSLFWCAVHHQRIIARLNARSEFAALPSDVKMVQYCRDVIQDLKWMLLPLCP